VRDCYLLPSGIDQMLLVGCFGCFGGLVNCVCDHFRLGHENRMTGGNLGDLGVDPLAQLGFVLQAAF